MLKSPIRMMQFTITMSMTIKITVTVMGPISLENGGDRSIATDYFTVYVSPVELYSPGGAGVSTYSWQGVSCPSKYAYPSLVCLAIDTLATDSVLYLLIFTQS